MGPFNDPRPLIEINAVPDIYVDGIGEIENLGDTFRTIYFVLARPTGGGPMERVIAVRLIRPRRSLLLPHGGMGQWLATHPVETVERLHS